MYKVLYRKYRPQFFADVVGQPQVTVTLKNELMRGRISTLICSPVPLRNGQDHLCQNFGQSGQLSESAKRDPCGECEVCRGLEEGSILDVVEIDAASNNGVDSIRTLIEESNFTPATAKYRVYIIDEVHMLSVAALTAAENLGRTASPSFSFWLPRRFINCFPRSCPGARDLTSNVSLRRQLQTVWNLSAPRRVRRLTGKRRCSLPVLRTAPYGTPLSCWTNAWAGTAMSP